MSLAGLGVLIFLMLQLPSSDAGPPPTSANYVDNAGCVQVGCHEIFNATYNQTAHAHAYSNLIQGFHLQSCVPCHVTGGGHPEIYPQGVYNFTTNTPIYLQNVTCQGCHGPGSLHEAAPFNQKMQTIGLVMNSSLCGSCHFATGGIGSQHHPTYNEWLISGHANTTLPRYAAGNVECANCHEAWMSMKLVEGGAFRTTYRVGSEDAPITWEIACATCHDPHNLGQGTFQLRLPPTEICQKCHNSAGAQPGTAPHHPMAEMRNDTAGFGIDRSGTSYMPTVSCFNCHMGITNAGLPNHTFMPNPSACLACHAPGGVSPTFDNLSVAESVIEHIAASTNAGITAYGPMVDDALALMNEMAGNRTGQNLSSWNHQYEIAIFNLESVISDKSSGNHNPGLASRLLGDARNRSDAVIANLTPPPKISGVTVVDEGGGRIKISWTTSTVSDFSKYRIYVLKSLKSNITDSTWRLQLDEKGTSSVSIDDIRAGTYYVYVTAVDTNGNEITNTLSPTSIAVKGGGGLSTEATALIAAVIIVAVVAAVVGITMMRKRKGMKPEAPSKP